MESVQPDPCVQHLPYFIAVREVDCSVPGVCPCGSGCKEHGSLYRMVNFGKWH